MKKPEKEPSADLKIQLEAQELKIDKEASDIYNKAVAEIDKLGRVIVPTCTFYGQNVKWQIRIVRK